MILSLIIIINIKIFNLFDLLSFITFINMKHLMFNDTVC